MAEPQKYAEISGLRVYFEPSGDNIRFEIISCDDIVAKTSLSKGDITKLGAFINAIPLNDQLPF